MKEILIVAGIALVVTAYVFDNNAPPKAEEIGVKGVSVSCPAGTRKGDEIIGDFKLTDQFKDVKYRTTVFDDNDPVAKGQRNDSAFPISGGTTHI